MRSLSQIMLVVVLAMGSTPAMSQTKPPKCDTEGHRAFDFWLGKWDVRTPDGKLVGHNEISLEYNACVLHERYASIKGYQGESLNIYDPARDKWHQTWVDTAGTLLVLEGGMREGSMVMAGATGSDDKPTRQRITWTPNPDGSVRQLWEATDEKGEWSVVFDGRYSKALP